jgi:SnoaL-like domain
MTLDELVARQSVVDGLYRYCRSLDRMDRDLYWRVFEPEAHLDYGEHFAGTAAEFLEWVWKAHGAMQVHSHQITNVLTQVDSDGTGAASEAYVTVCLRTKPDEDGKISDIVDRGRYLDRWVRHPDGAWRISDRLYVTDIAQVADASSAPPVVAVRDLRDPSYQLFSRTPL